MAAAAMMMKMEPTVRSVEKVWRAKVARLS
jgi:hypothetical protein